LRIAAVGDVHCSKLSAGRYQAVFEAAGSRADVLLLCGDLTQRGLPEEARLLLRDLKAVTLPILAVLGNHDFEAERRRRSRASSRMAG
jgi:Icc-related predicted phosphoesterase